MYHFRQSSLILICYHMLSNMYGDSIKAKFLEQLQGKVEL